MKYEPIRPHFREELKINIEVYQNEKTATCPPCGRVFWGKFKGGAKLAVSGVWHTVISQQEDFNSDPRGEQKVAAHHQHRIDPPGDGGAQTASWILSLHLSPVQRSSLHCCVVVCLSYTGTSCWEKTVWQTWLPVCPSDSPSLVSDLRFCAASLIWW